MSGPPGSAARFFGRVSARRRLGAVLADAAAGRFRFAVVSGEAGIGKSALLARTVLDEGPAGLEPVWATCWDAERAPALWPWLQVLDDLGISPTGMLEASAVHAGSDDRDAEHARLRLFGEISRLLVRSATERARAVVLDDLQWADPSSLELLEYLVRSQLRAPLALLGAYRSDELTGPTAERLAGLTGLAEHVRLSGLTAAEVDELVTDSAGAELARRWSTTVHSRTAGHPLFVREVAQLLVDEPGADLASTVPGAARMLIHRRLADLPTPTRRLLDVAAVAGTVLAPDVLAEVLGLDPPGVAECIEDAQRHGVLTGAEGPVRFAHDLYRETIYTSLPLDGRLELHRRVGTAMEQRREAGADIFPAEIARQFVAAIRLDGADRAVRWSRAAADAERARLAFAEAAGHLRRVRLALRDAGVSVDAAVLVELLRVEADAEARAGDPGSARRLLGEARQLAAQLPDAAQLADVALGIQRLGARFAMPRDEVIGVLRVAHEALAGSATTIEARVTAALARELAHSVPDQRAPVLALAQRAVEVARQLDDPSTLAECLLAQHDALWTPSTVTERIGLAEEILVQARRADDVERQVEALLLTANALLESGSPAFRVPLAEYLRRTAGFEQPRYDYLGATRHAALALLDGELAHAEQLIEDAAQLGEQIGEPDAGNVRMSQLLDLARARGEPDRLRAVAAAAVDWWVGIPSHAHAVAAGLLARAGDLDAARRALDVVVELDRWREDRSYMWPVFVGGLAAAAVRLDDRKLLAELDTELAEVAGNCGVNGAVVCFVGCNAHWAGVVAAARGDTARAVAHLERALTVHVQLGARSWEAETAAELGDVLGPSGAGHRARAGRLAVELGMAGLRERLDPGPAVERPDAASAAFRRDGELWLVGWRGRTTHIRDTKGMRDLATLLARPGPVGVLELASSRVDETGAGQLLDAAARADYRRRLTELTELADELAATGQDTKAQQVDDERATLLEELRRATGLGGRDRGLTAVTVERARKAVSARVREAITRIGAVLPELGTHLDRSVRTGSACQYRPIEPVQWDLGTRSAGRPT